MSLKPTIVTKHISDVTLDRFGLSEVMSHQPSNGMTNLNRGSGAVSLSQIGNSTLYLIFKNNRLGINPMAYGDYIKQELSGLKHLEDQINTQTVNMQLITTVSAAAVHTSVIRYAKKRLAKERKRLEKIQELRRDGQQQN